MTASVGIAFAGDGDDDLPSQLMRDADAAMYQVKRRGGGQQRRLDVEVREQNGAFVDLELELRKAFVVGELQVHYQPIRCSLDGRLTGAEALLRWRHPSRGQIRVADMIAVAERSSLVSEIGAWVLERACTDQQRWLRAASAARGYGEPLSVAVNVSASQLMAAGFLPSVERVLRLSGISPDALVLELTESTRLGDADDLPAVVGVLDRLKSLGVRIALDDFGTGYSSLQYLRAFPVDVLKIDQSFVACLGSDSTAETILTAVTNLAHVLGLNVITEGVETQDQLDALVAVGCESVQGFYLGRPMPREQFQRLVTEGSGGQLGLADRACASSVREAGSGERSG